MVFRDTIEDLRADDRTSAHESIVISATQASHRAMREVILWRTTHQTTCLVDVSVGEMFLETASTRRRIYGDVFEAASRAIYRVDGIALAHMITFDFAGGRWHRPYCVVADNTVSILPT